MKLEQATIEMLGSCDKVTITKEYIEGTGGPGIEIRTEKPLPALDSQAGKPALGMEEQANVSGTGQLQEE